MSKFIFNTLDLCIFIELLFPKLENCSQRFVLVLHIAIVGCFIFFLSSQSILYFYYALQQSSVSHKFYFTPKSLLQHRAFHIYFCFEIRLNNQYVRFQAFLLWFFRLFCVACFLLSSWQGMFKKTFILLFNKLGNFEESKKVLGLRFCDGF